MSITTKTGDKGVTSLLFGGLDKKDSPRMECCGALDELCSFLGLAKSVAKDKFAKALLEKVQNDLFVACSEVATKKSFIHKLNKRLGNNEIAYLESLIKALEKKYISKRCSFILPGENTFSAMLDVARAAARKAERKVVALKREKILKNPFAIVYLNRLSDLLFLMARSYEKPKR
ncbi:MAG: cob(I)yrinic acid a,c-diamide adenosyltransferase [Candidatus Omnitrophica bacterium]|nr:cob(I)yrinic acid a,c-diamide adenosyltransferase [Candidatus Omnitrophota bacterium]MBU4488209.1 cob(I)yrinic acid a,c-diamide adenosyltransferase [Candidatus Omnitrophota bacterium]MCG2705388.1 cob(I)yrinic acid a,c-diamide adenosyltransferase [Candidatus Omnitrophota bacterium]